MILTTYAMDLFIQVELKKRLLQSCIHHFNRIKIFDIDHMRIPGTEPSSVILSQT